MSWGNEFMRPSSSSSRPTPLGGLTFSWTRSHKPDSARIHTHTHTGLILFSTSQPLGFGVFHSLPKALLPFFFFSFSSFFKIFFLSFKSACCGVESLGALGFFFFFLFSRLPFSPSLRRHTCPLKELAGCKRRARCGV